MRRPLPPLWLTRPSRYAGVSQQTARLLLAALGLLILLALSAFATPDPTGPAKAPGGITDLQLYTDITETLRHGGSYYATTADALRIGHYPLRPFVTFRLPTLAVVQASLPPPLVAALLYTLALGVAVVWYARLREALRRPLAVWSAMLLLAAGCIACWQVDLAPFHEVWAGLLIALSLGRYRPGQWLEAVGWGLAAALIRETAALYLLVMAAFAWRDTARREALGWAAALAVLALVLLAHAHAVVQVVTPADPASPGWTGLLGPGFAVRTWATSTALSLLPLLLGAPLVALALAGWTAWAEPVAARVAATLFGYGTLLATAGRLDTFYWGLLSAPLLLVGLAFAPDGVRDLWSAALDRRRFTVRRVSP